MASSPNASVIRLLILHDAINSVMEFQAGWFWCASSVETSMKNFKNFLWTLFTDMPPYNAEGLTPPKIRL